PVVEPSIAVLVEEQEQVHKESVTSRAQLCRAVLRDVELWVEELVVQAETVGIVIFAQDDPDGLMTALLGVDLVQLQETGQVDAPLRVLGRRSLGCFGN